MDGSVEGGAVVAVERAVVVVVGVARVAQLVLVRVGLVRVGELGAVVRLVHYAVAVVIRVHAVGLAILVEVVEALVGGFVAVVVLAVADLLGTREDGLVQRPAVPRLGRRVELERSAEALALGRHAEAVAVEVHVVGLARLGPGLVGVPVAVVVDAVAGLGGRMGDGRVEGSAVGDVGVAVAVVVEVARVARQVAVGIDLLRVGHAEAVVHAVVHAVPVYVAVTLVADAVAVRILLLGILDQGTVVHAVGNAILVIVPVARIALAVAIGIDLVWVGHEGAVVGRVRGPVAVAVPRLGQLEPATEVAHVAEAVVVGILLAGVGHEGAVVHVVCDAVAVVVAVHAVRAAVAVQVVEVLVRHPVAVVVRPVAHLRHGALHGVTLLELAVLALVDRVFADALAAGAAPEGLVHLAVAVVVGAVAALGGSRMDGRVEGRTVAVVRAQVVVVVGVAGIPLAVEVEVGLVLVGHARAVVEPVHDAVAVIVVGHAVGHAVLVGVGKALVGLAVAVVVLAVAFLLRCRPLQGVAFLELALDAVLHGVLADAHAARRLAEALVRHAVTVVILPVAALFLGNGGVAVGETVGRAPPLPLARAQLVLHEAARRRPLGDGQGRAVAHPRRRHALEPDLVAHHLDLSADVVCRAVLVHPTGAAAEAAVGAGIETAGAGVAIRVAGVVALAGEANAHVLRQAEEERVAPGRGVLETEPAIGAVLHARDGADLALAALDAIARIALRVVHAGPTHAAGTDDVRGERIPRIKGDELEEVQPHVDAQVPAPVLPRDLLLHHIHGVRHPGQILLDSRLGASATHEQTDAQNPKEPLSHDQPLLEKNALQLQHSLLPVPARVKPAGKARCRDCPGALPAHHPSTCAPCSATRAKGCTSVRHAHHITALTVRAATQVRKNRPSGSRPARGRVGG
jgi:hypothetical protein